MPWSRSSGSVPDRRPKAGGKSRLLVTAIYTGQSARRKAPSGWGLGIVEKAFRRREMGCPRGMPAGGDSGRSGPLTGAPPRGRRDHGAANAEPQWRRVVRHHGDHGDLRLEGTAPCGDACADGPWRGAVWPWTPKGQCHRAQGIAWVLGDRRARWSGVWARTAAGPCPFVLCLNQLQICLNRARPVELRLARWLDMGGGMSGAHRKPTGGTSLQVPGPSVHCGPMVPHPGGGEQKHGDRHRLGAVMGVLSHYLHWRQGAGTHPPEAHFAPGGRAARACGY